MRIGAQVLGAVILMSAMWGFFMLPAGTEASEPIAPTVRYVDAAGSSTYTTIQDAVDDAADGDTIIIAAGDYDESQLNVGQSNILIQGNTSGTGVRITCGLSGPSAYVHDVTNVTFMNINFTSTDYQAMRVHLSDNVTFTGCIFWTQGGTYGSLFVDNCENITIAGDFFSGTLALIHSEGDNNPALKIDTSDHVITYIAKIESNGSSSDAVACYGTCSYIAVAIALVDAKGQNSDAFSSTGSISGMALGMDATYTAKMFDIASGSFQVVSSNVPNNDVSVGSGATLTVYFERLVTVMDENGDPVAGVEIKIENDYDGVVYSTPRFGGSDPVSDSFGEFERVMFFTKVFQGLTMDYGENTVSVFYNGDDEPVGMTLGNVDANTSDDLELTLPDFAHPEDPANVTAETISHEQIDLSFDASPSADVDHYEVWVDSGSGFRWDLNTSSPGTFSYVDLPPSTEYGFRVIAVDDAGWMSDGVEVSNTTFPPIGGDISGMVRYNEGPMDGAVAEGTLVTLFNTTMESIASQTINATGMYMFHDVLFGEGYLLRAVPPDAVADGGEKNGYLAWEWTFDHTGELTKNISIPYYLYDSDDISGHVVYSGGPLDGQNATNATVYLLNETGVEMANATVGDDGSYMFDDIRFGVNYTLRVVPAAGVIMGETASGYTIWELTFDHVGELVKNVTIDYYLYDSDDISGRVIYAGGPMDGRNVTNATVFLYNETMVELANATVNGTTGMYLLEDVPFGTNYTLKVVFRDAVEKGGTVSGYIINLSAPFAHSGKTVMDIDIEYYTYTPPPPSKGTVTGIVTYSGGDLDGEPVPGAVVSLKGSDGEYINTTTNQTGHYLFDNVEFGDYTLTVLPPADMQGEENVKSGYMGTEEEVTLDSADGVILNVELLYYEGPEETHPRVVVKDKDGEPLEGVTVTVTIGDDVYTAVTNADGVAVFADLVGDSFPADAAFKAEKEGYDTVEWSSGEAVPRMQKEKKEDSTLMYILIAVVVVILLVVIFLMFRKKEEGPYEE